MAIFQKRLEGLTNDETYFAKVFTVNHKERVNNRIDLPVVSAMPRASRLPHGYTEVEYIESTGSQYINTGVTGISGLMADGAMMPLSIPASGGAVFLGAYPPQWYMVYFNKGSTGYSYNSWKSGSKGMQVGVKHEFAVDFTGGNQSFKLDGEVICSSNIAETVCSSSLFAFAGNISGGASYFAIARLYNLRMYTKDTLLRDFVPCVSDVDGAGLFDLVSKTFYKNLGSGSFIAGPAV